MNCKPLGHNAGHPIPSYFGRILLFLVLTLLGTVSSHATSQQVVFDITGFTVENGLAQSGTSTAVLPPAYAYSYLISGTVHGTGALANVVPAGTSLATALEAIQSGFSSNLQGVVANPGGTIPFTVLDHKTAAGNFNFFIESISASATFSVYVDAAGHAIFTIDPVVFLVNGSPDTSDTIVFDSGSVTTTAVLSPVTTTGTASLVTGSSANLNATVNPNGDAATVTFEYGFDQTYGSTTTPQVVPQAISAAAVSGSIAGLLPGTTYHFRVDAMNTTGTSAGADMMFTTAGAISGTLPTITTGTTNSVTSSGATLNGQVNPNGETTYAWFEYGTDTNYTDGATPQQFAASGNTTEGYLANLANLSPGATYHYRAVASNSSGPSYGTDQTFTTSVVAGVPTATTGTTTNLTASSATVHASVDPDAADTSVYFEYGFDTSYGSTTTPVDIGSGSSTVAVSATLGSLVSGSTYHYAVVAQNSEGSPVVGSDATFVVPTAAPPTVTTGAATAGAAGTEEIFATVNPNGTSTTVSFNFGPTATYTGTTPSINVGSGTTPVLCTGTLTGIQPGATYHYQAQAINGADTLVTGSDASFTAPFSFSSYAAKFAAAFSGGSFDSSGLASIAITSAGKYTASVKTAAGAVSLSGSFSGNGAASAMRSGLTLAMQLGNSSGISVISGTLSGIAQGSFVAYPVLTTATARAYTVRLPHPSDVTLPQGNGYGALTVSRKGAIRLVGKLGDGTAFTASSNLLANQSMPLYVPLYKNKGCIVGTLTFESTANGDLDGTVYWSKPLTTGLYTPAPFSTNVSLYGSLYVTPLRGHPVISSTSGNLILNAGNLTLPAPPDDISTVLTSANKFLFPVPTDHLTLKISTSTGIFSGAFRDPATNITRDFNGAVFQGALNFGTGVFKGSTEAGSVDLFTH